MTEIVKRLRLGAVIAPDQLASKLHKDAADEIERLRGIETIAKRIVMWPGIIGTQEWCELNEVLEKPDSQQSVHGQEKP